MLGVFPTFIGSLVILRSVILFKRGSIANKEVRRWWRLLLPCGAADGGWSVVAPLRASRHATALLPPQTPHPPLAQRFNAWIDGQRAASPQTGLAVYPEGHRSTMGESLPLKRGMLYYAFTRKLPVQVGGG